MNDPSTYLVTGCAGFIAAEVAMQLLAAGNHVIGIDNLNDYYDIRLKEYRLEQLIEVGESRFHCIRGDIEDAALVNTLFDRHSFDGVLNLAARAGVRYSLINPHVYLTTNAIGSLNLLEAMRHKGVTKYVLASTSSLYAGQPMPFVESLPVNEPISPYAASKKAAEAMAYSYHHLFGIDVTICRYFTVYGPAGRPDMSIFRFIRWIDEEAPIELFGDGQQSRDFTYVDDIARGTIAALTPVGYEVINLGGGGVPVTLNDVISQLERLLGKRAIIHKEPFNKADLMSTSADISKAKRLLNWQPETSLEIGLARCVDWYKANLSWASQLALP